MNGVNLVVIKFLHRWCHAIRRFSCQLFADIAFQASVSCTLLHHLQLWGVVIWLLFEFDLITCSFARILSLSLLSRNLCIHGSLHARNDVTLEIGEQFQALLLWVTWWTNNSFISIHVTWAREPRLRSHWRDDLPWSILVTFAQLYANVIFLISVWHTIALLCLGGRAGCMTFHLTFSHS